MYKGVQIDDMIARCSKMRQDDQISGLRDQFNGLNLLSYLTASILIPCCLLAKYLVSLLV